MKIIIKVSMLMLAFCMPAWSQGTGKVTKEEIKVMVNQIADSLKFYYVSSEMAKNIGNHMIDAEQKGVFNNIENPDSLAVAMTRELRSVNGDLHLSFWQIKPNSNGEREYSYVEEKMKYAKSNFGLSEAKILKGNVGYLKISHFSNWDFFDETQVATNSAMGFLQNASSLIFDLRDNRGGVPNLVAYLCSYLFEGEKVHLAQYHHRYQNNQSGLYTYDEVAGKRLPDVPVFVLVNDRSASAAEEFAYFLKHLGRASIVGDTTAGAGYGAMSHKLNDRFTVSISSEEDISPMTNTSFENVGVIPDVYADDESSFEIALALAQKAANIYELEKKTKYQALYIEIQNLTASRDLELVIRTIEKGHSASLIGRNRINSIGYEFLSDFPEIAEEIFKLNTVYYPNSSNVFDSYGDGLKTVGKNEEALMNYEQALKLGRLEDSRNVDTYARNVEEMKRILALKKEGKK